MDSLMRPNRIVIAMDIFPEQKYQMFFAKRDDVIQQFPAQDTDSSFVSVKSSTHRILKLHMR